MLAGGSHCHRARSRDGAEAWSATLRGVSAVVMWRWRRRIEVLSPRTARGTSLSQYSRALRQETWLTAAAHFSPPGNGHECSRSFSLGIPPRREGRRAVDGSASTRLATVGPIGVACPTGSTRCRLKRRPRRQGSRTCRPSRASTCPRSVASARGVRKSTPPSTRVPLCTPDALNFLLDV